MKEIKTNNEKINELLSWSVDVEPFESVDEVEDYLILMKVSPENYGFDTYNDMAKYIFQFII
jgi:hypothetical protein